MCSNKQSTEYSDKHSETELQLALQQLSCAGCEVKSGLTRCIKLRSPYRGLRTHLSTVLCCVALRYVHTAPSVIETAESTRKLTDFELKMQTVQLPKRRAALKYKMMCAVHNNNTSVGIYNNHYAGPVDGQERSTRVHIQRRSAL